MKEILSLCIQNLQNSDIFMEKWEVQQKKKHIFAQKKHKKALFRKIPEKKKKSTKKHMCFLKALCTTPESTLKVP